MGVAWVEHYALFWRLSQLHDGTSHLVDGREFKTAVQILIWHHAYHNVCTQAGKEIVGVEVYLKLSVSLTSREVAHTHYLCAKPMMSYGL